MTAEDIAGDEAGLATAVAQGGEKSRFVLEQHGDRLGPRRAVFHPRLKRGDFLVRQFFLGRHGEFFGRVPHGLEQQALGRITGHHGGTGLAALEQGGAGVEAQAGFLFFRAVAVETFVRQQRPHLIAEKRRVRGGGSGGGSGGGDGGDGGEESEGEEQRGFHGG